MPRPGQFSAPVVVSQVHFLRQNGNRRRRRLGVHMPEGSQLRSGGRHLQLGSRTRVQRVNREWGGIEYSRNYESGWWMWRLGRCREASRERERGEKKTHVVSVKRVRAGRACPAKQPATILISFAHTWMNIVLRRPDGALQTWLDVCGRKTEIEGVDWRCGVVCVYEYGGVFGLQCDKRRVTEICDGLFGYIWLVLLGITIISTAKLEHQITRSWPTVAPSHIILCTTHCIEKA